MRSDNDLEIADCTEIRQAVQARPPWVVHGSLFLLVALLGAALAWGAATRANLVVLATGRVRPVTTPVRIANAARAEVLSASAGARVVEVNAREGDLVKRGQALIRLETERLDNEIAKQLRAIRAGEAELASMDHQGELQGHQYEVAKAKAEAELTQAEVSVQRAKERQEAEIQLAQLALEAAKQDEASTRGLRQRDAVAPLDLYKATVKTHEAQARLAQARIPVDEGDVRTLRRVLELVERDYALKREELRQKCDIRRSEVEAARIELGNLEAERQHAVLRAPIDGIVTTGDVKVGDVLTPNEVALEVARLEGFRFEAAVPGEDVGLLRVGLPARIKLDAYDYQRYGTVAGTVCFISPDSGSAEGRQTGAYTVKVVIHQEEVGRGASRGRVKLGMSGQAEIITDRESLLSLLTRRVRQTIRLD
jgi:hemolysin D